MFVLNGVVTEEGEMPIDDSLACERKRFQFNADLLTFVHKAGVAIEHIGFDDKR